MLDKIRAYLDDHEYFFLIISHVAMMILYPFVVTEWGSSVWLHLLITLILITWLYAVNTHRKFVMSSLVLWGISLALTWMSFAYIDDYVITLLFNIVGLLFFLIITINLIINLYTFDEVDHHMVFGAIAGYLLLWLLWAFMFAIIEITHPGSFAWFDVMNVSFPDFMYFSYVNMTTLWFGDVVPVSYHAQSWSILLSISGQMYLAVMIGMIVGKYVRRKKIIPKL